jgi:hypothetical protein
MITINKSAELKEIFLRKHERRPVGKTPGQPFADRLLKYKIKGGVHYISISGYEGNIGGVISVHHLKPSGNYTHHLL